MPGINYSVYQRVTQKRRNLSIPLPVAYYYYLPDAFHVLNTIRTLSQKLSEISTYYFYLPLKTQNPSFQVSLTPLNSLPSYRRIAYPDLILVFPLLLGAVHKVCHAFFDDFWPPPVTNCHKSWTPPKSMSHFLDPPPIRIRQYYMWK